MFSSRGKAIIFGFVVGLLAVGWLFALDWGIAICVLTIIWADRFVRSL